jgi:predicted nuclease with TOPRIM domain
MRYIATARMDRVLEKRQGEITKVRDKLDETISELQSLRDDCDEAWQHLEDARDALSRVV